MWEAPFSEKGVTISFQGELIAILTTLCWSIGIFPFTEASRRIGPLPVNIYRLLMALIIVSLILLTGYGISFSGLFSRPTAAHYQWLILSGIIGFTIGDFFGFSSFIRLGPRLASIYTTLGPGFALLFGFFMLDEKINLAGFTGILITLSGVLWLTRSRGEHEQNAKAGFKTDATGIVFGVGSALCQGLGLTLSKMGLLENSPLHTINEIHSNWIRLLGATASGLLFSVFSGNFFKHVLPVLTNKNNGTWFMLLGTIFGPVLGVSFSLMAISKISVAVAQTIFALLPVFVLPLNYLFYREKITLTTILACLVSIGGVFVLIWRNYF